MAEQLGSGGLTVEAKTFYVKELLARAVPTFCFLGYGIKKNIPARGGLNLEWRQLQRPAVATTALTQGTPPSAQAITWTNVTATILQYGAFARLSDLAYSQSFDEQVSELVGMWGEHMGETLDIIARNELIAGTNVQYAGSGGSRGNVSGPLIEAEVRKALATMKRNNIRKVASVGRYVLIAHPNTENDFLGSPTGNMSYILTQAGARGGDNPIFTGDSYDYLGVRIMYTSNAKVYGSAGLSAIGVFTALLIGEGFYGESRLSEATGEIITHPIGSAGAQDPLNQYGTVGWKAALAVRRLQEANGLRIEHTSSIDVQGGN